MKSKGVRVMLRTEADVTAATKMIADHYCNDGFPIFSLNRDEKRAELNKLLNYDYTRKIQQDEHGGTIIGQSMHGLALAWNYHPHAWNIECVDRRTPLDTFCDRNVLEKAIEQILSDILENGASGTVTDNLLRKRLRDFRGSQGVSNFRPTAAAAIYERCMPEGGVAWDISSGFGGRLLGAIACKKVEKYIGSDPATLTMDGLRQMSAEVLPMALEMKKRELEVELYMLGSETKEMRDLLPQGGVDLCFSSPPYYAQEHYSQEETQSYVQFPDQKSWLEGYLGSTLDNCAYCLKPNGTLAINIADVGSYKGSLTADFLALAAQRGWERMETLKLSLSRGRAAKHKGNYNYEPIYVFKKGTKKVFTMKASKKIICADSLEWLPANRDQGSILTSLPDASEIGMDNLDEYDKWVRRAATEIFLSASEGCPVVFIQTDRRKDGRQFSKANLLMNIAAENGWFLLWHKIELTADVGKSNLYRPTFRNMICFGKGKMSAGQATADVVPKSKRLYDMAFGFDAARACLEFCKKFSNRVLDPFCGHGTTLHVAEELGMDSVGVDISTECCEAARNFKPEASRSAH